MKSIQRGQGVPWFFVLSVGMALGCTTEDGGGAGGGKPGSDEASSSSSGTIDDKDIEYPECSPGVTKIFATHANQEVRQELEFPTDYPWISLAYLRLIFPEDGFLYLTWSSEDQNQDKWDQLLPVVGGMRFPGTDTFIPALTGSTAFVASVPGKRTEFAFIRFHVVSEFTGEE
jgi:hypothetical protein